MAFGKITADSLQTAFRTFGISGVTDLAAMEYQKMMRLYPLLY